MGFCDRCNKYRELRFLVSYASGMKTVLAVCEECPRSLSIVAKPLPKGDDDLYDYFLSNP